MNRSKILVVFLVVSVMAISSCEPLKKEKKEGEKIKNGLVKQYYPNGNLKISINYKDGKRNGLAKSFYKNGKLRQQMNYINNIKDGIVTTYYQNGRKYQETQYSKGKIEGIRKKYRMNGKLMAEIPYTDDEPCAGLVEYLLNGEKKTIYPEIRITPVDNLLKENRYTLILSISDGSKDVDFYSGELLEDGCIPHYAIPIGAGEDGTAKVNYKLPPNAFIMEEMHFIAKIETTLGNPYIIETSHYLAIENR